MSDNTRSVVDMNGVRYELVELIGRGGQGAVYTVKGQRLAVKVLTGRNQHRQDLMRNQLTLVKRLPLQELCLAKPLEMLRPPHMGYVMELLTGMIPIKHLFTPSKGETPSVEWYFKLGGLKKRLLVLARAAQILAQLHSKGLAYSDPSPANIFISADPKFVEVWFIDTDNLRYESAPGLLSNVCTPGYGAPELVQGKSGVTSLTDVYAFAVIAFQTLTLAHPFIGDQVNDGDPELEEQAYAGQLPWIEDEKDDSNRATFGIPRKWVLSPRLKETFQRTFGLGRLAPSERPGAAELAERLFAAAESTIQCKNCGGSFYFNQEQCAWCDTDRANFATAQFYIWAPEIGTNGEIVTSTQRGHKREVLVAHAAATSTSPLIITRRLAFDHIGPNSEEPVIEVSLEKNYLMIRSLDGKQYQLVSTSGNHRSIISEQPQKIQFPTGSTRSVVPWRIHFGAKTCRHRVLGFEYWPERNA